MKHKKIIIASVTVLAVIAIAITATAIVEHTKSKDIGNPDVYFEDATVATEKNYTTATGESIGLTYYRSLERSDGSLIHYYRDLDENEYCFDENGNLNSYSGKSEAVAQNEGAVLQTAENDVQATDGELTDEEKMIRSARQYAAQTYGEEYVSKFQYRETTHVTDTGVSRVFFEIRYKEMFVADGLMVAFDSNGTATKVNVYSQGIDAGFDESLLDNVEVEDIMAYLDAKVETSYPGATYELESKFYIELNEENEYVISAPIKVTKMDAVSPIRVEYFYSFE